MHRFLKIKIMFIPVTLSLLCCLCRQATAFTLRFGPLNEVEARRSVTEAPDLPTPQLLRIVIRQDEVILGATHPAEGFGRPEPAIGLPETAAPPPAQTSEPQAVHRQLDRHRLSGVELLLLRDTQVTAEQPEKAQAR